MLLMSVSSETMSAHAFTIACYVPIALVQDIKPTANRTACEPIHDDLAMNQIHLYPPPLITLSQVSRGGSDEIENLR